MSEVEWARILADDRKSRPHMRGVGRRIAGELRPTPGRFHSTERFCSPRASAEVLDVSLADRDYWRDVPEYRRLMDGGGTPSPMRGRSASSSWFAVVVVVAVFGLVVLPHVTILGRHWFVG